VEVSGVVAAHVGVVPILKHLLLFTDTVHAGDTVDVRIFLEIIIDVGLHERSHIHVTDVVNWSLALDWLRCLPDFRVLSLRGRLAGLTLLLNSR